MLISINHTKLVIQKYWLSW